MKVTPLMICRTKYVDYNDPVFCAASDLSNEFQKNLHDIIINGNNLKFTDECKVFVSNNSHIIIGKVLYIKKLPISIDDSLDKEAEGRSAWGFIGGSIVRSDYEKEGKILDLPIQFYIDAYTRCLYENHWRESVFHGPYCYEAIETDMDTLDDITQAFEEEQIPIYLDTKNAVLFQIAIKKTLEGQSVAFCSNEEFNAAEALIKRALNFTTVSSANYNDQVESYKKISTNKKREESVFKRNSQLSQNSSCTFIEELRSLCEKYNYPTPQEQDYKKGNKRLKGYFIVTGYSEEPENESFLGKIFGGR